MALQIDVDNKIANREGSGGILSMRLRCWLEAADPEADDPIINVVKNSYVKGRVEGLSLQQLVNRAMTDIGNQMQLEIDDYLYEQSVLDLVDESQIENALTG